MDDDLDRRLAAASERLATLSADLRARAPWPLAARFDHTPEASWGPPEILAHLEEMLPFWLGEAERIMAANEPIPFGRVATDERRLAIIDRDRRLPIDELLTRVQRGIEEWRRAIAGIDVAARAHQGIHPTLGVLDIDAIAIRFAVSHVEDHLDQLADALPAAEPLTARG
jgi:hypothetical protein